MADAGDWLCGSCGDGAPGARACGLACSTMGCPLAPRQWPAALGAAASDPAAPAGAVPPRLRAVMQHLAVMGIPRAEDLLRANPSGIGRAPRLLPGGCAHNAPVAAAGPRPARGELLSCGEVRFELGAHELGRDCYCYLQPHGQWGYSNSGLVVGDSGGSLMVARSNLKREFY